MDPSCHIFLENYFPTCTCLYHTCYIEHTPHVTDNMYVYACVSLFQVIQPFRLQIKLVVPSITCLWKVLCTMSYSDLSRFPGDHYCLKTPSQPCRASFSPSVPRLRRGIEPPEFLQNHLHETDVCVVNFFLAFFALRGYLSCSKLLNDPRLRPQ